MTKEKATMGRPYIGPMLNFRLDDSTLEIVDVIAATQQMPRAQWLRRAVQQRRGLPQEQAPGFMRWLSENGFDLDGIIYAIEKPGKYELEWLLYKAGRELDHADELGPEERDLLLGELRGLRARELGVDPGVLVNWVGV